MTAPTSWKPTEEEALKRIEGRLFATVPEAAVILRYHARTLRAAIVEGEVPAIRAGSTYRIPVEWIRKQLEVGTDSAPGAA